MEAKAPTKFSRDWDLELRKWQEPEGCLSPFSILLLPLGTCTCLVPLSTHWLFLSLSQHGSLRTLKLDTISFEAQFLGKKMRMDHLRLCPPVQSWYRDLTSCEGESLSKGVIVGWANSPTVSFPTRLEPVSLPTASSQPPQRALTLVLVFLQNCPKGWWPCTASHRRLRWS